MGKGERRREIDVPMISKHCALVAINSEMGITFSSELVGEEVFLSPGESNDDSMLIPRMNMRSEM